MRMPLGEIVKLAGYAEAPPIPPPLFVGNSRVIQVWDVPRDRNTARQALEAGTVEVLTLSAHRKIPDEGIARFVELALAHYPAARVTVQEGRFAFDHEAGDPVPGPAPKEGKPPIAWDSATAESLLQRHAQYFRELEDYVAALNRERERPVVFLVPTCRAVIALREHVRLGQLPGIATQAELFSDRMGHPRPVLDVLNAYCHFAVIFRRSPVGLGIPASLRQVPAEHRAAINTLLQEIAWDLTIHHPLSGVTASQ